MTKIEGFISSVNPGMEGGKSSVATLRSATEGGGLHFGALHLRTSEQEVNTCRHILWGMARRNGRYALGAAA